jgi:hypothetical protein
MIQYLLLIPMDGEIDPAVYLLACRQIFTSISPPTGFPNIISLYFHSGYMDSARFMPSSSRIGSSSLRYSSYWLGFSTLCLIPGCFVSLSPIDGFEKAVYSTHPRRFAQQLESHCSDEQLGERRRQRSVTEQDRKQRHCSSFAVGKTDISFGNARLVGDQ